MRAVLPLVPLDAQCLAPMDPERDLLDKLVLRRLHHFNGGGVSPASHRRDESKILRHEDVTSPYAFHHQLRSHQLAAAAAEPTYVRCSNAACARFTRTTKDTDPSTFPRYWTCSMAEPKM